MLRTSCGINPRIKIIFQCSYKKNVSFEEYARDKVTIEKIDKVVSQSVFQTNSFLGMFKK